MNSSIPSHGTKTYLDLPNEETLLTEVIRLTLSRDAIQQQNTREQIEALLEELESQRQQAHEQTEEQMEEETDQFEKTALSLEDEISIWIAELDKELSEQLNEILHAPAFQELESSWRSLYDLANRTETSPELKIAVLDMTKDELRKDLEKAGMKFERSELFRKVYKDRFAKPGGEPFGALIGDYSFSHLPYDVSTLEKASHVAAAAHAPFIASADPHILNLGSFDLCRCHNYDDTSLNSSSLFRNHVL